MPKHAAPRSCVSLEGIRFLGFSVESASKLLSEDEFVTNTNGDYRGVFSKHGYLCVLLGLFFSWLLSFPLLGPSLYALAGSNGIDATGIGATFLLLHGLGLIGYGAWGRRYLISLSRVRFGKGEIRLTDNIVGEDAINLVVMGLSCVVCFGFTVAFAHVPYGAWRWLAFLSGFAASPFVVTCASEMARTTPRNELGRTFALSMVIANIALYIHTAFLVYQGPSVTLAVSSAWLLVSFLAVCHYGTKLPATDSGSRLIYEETASDKRLRLRLFFLSFAVLIIATSIIGGFAHRIVFPSLTLMSSVDRFYNVIPYVVMCFLCGWIADCVGRRHLANTGFVCLGLSMPLLSLFQLSGIRGYLITQTLTQGGHACIDVFLWVSLADIAPKDRVSSCYGIGLGLNVWVILLGMFFIERFLPIGDAGFSTISLVGTVVLFFGVMGLVRLEETLTHDWAIFQRTDTVETGISKGGPAVEPPCAFRGLSSTTGLSSKKRSHQVEAAIDHYVLNLMAAEYSITRRELEVVVLLLKGMTNDEIRERLCISEGTLKTHIRHVFQKLDISNRKELLVSFTRFLASSEEADDKAELH